MTSSAEAGDRQFGRTARRKARKKALDVLFEADLRGEDVNIVLKRREETDLLPEYAVTLVSGVREHWQRINDLLRTYAEGWELKRMPAVDRNILRIAVYELLHRDDVPDPVAIDEGVALAKELSTDESPKFINGLLGRVQLLKDDD